MRSYLRLRRPLRRAQHSFAALISCVLGIGLILGGCSSKYLKTDNEAKLKKNSEFENAVQISDTGFIEGTPSEKSIPNETAPVNPVMQVTPDSSLQSKKNVPPAEIKKNAKTKKELKDKKGKVITAVDALTAPATTGAISRRQPDLEDDEGFGGGRRPLVDPFRVGEEVVHDVRYFKMQAGSLKFKVEPFVQVNQRKAYTFAYEIETSSLFSSFYSVQDRAVVLVDFLELIPRVYTLHVKESAQLREARSFFDFDKLKATFWENKYTKKDGHEEKREQWDILNYSQNVFSAAYYMRAFQWRVGKEVAFRVSDNKENLVFKGKCVRQETLDTEAGKFDALVIKPEITLQGKFKPVGDIFIWLSNDDRKFILRIESSIKIGTIVSEVVKLNPGQ